MRAALLRAAVPTALWERTGNPSRHWQRAATDFRPKTALPFIASGALLTAFGAQKTVELVEERCVDPEEALSISSQQRTPSRPFWATSSHNLSNGTLAKIFGHVSTADAEVRKGAALVAAQAAEA